MVIEIGKTAVHISFWSATVLCTMLIFDRQMLFFKLFSAVCMHEAGHVIMLRIMHRRVRAVQLTAFGICLDIGTEQTLSYREEIQAALCGPLVNLLLCVIFALRRDVSAAGINAALFLINMLPVNTLDGGRILCALLSERASPAVSCKVIKATGLLCVLLLAVISLASFHSGRPNFTLPVICVYLYLLTFPRSAASLTGKNN
ncbi:MAG: site-2 protease family protein [Clostridia bacterium]|nr:site-2 protease family protein [Clostridia bacterium]